MLTTPTAIDPQPWRAMYGNVPRHDRVRINFCWGISACLVLGYRGRHKLQAHGTASRHALEPLAPGRLCAVYRHMLAAIHGGVGATGLQPPPQRLLAACSVPTRYCASYTVAAAPHAPHDAVAEVLTWWLWRMVCPQTMGVLLAQRERTLLGQAVPHSRARGVTWDVCLPP